ncbi:Protein of unknown function [Pyronema omphalodes CBS 100304]|uniref:Uncharacterized protein n=1 Tax=Pyronema omphalodes (strain CBS 100304) TaxID=1076935 RepID=U4L2M3_PYROM|nr:Protein of unknown function [Pyronema omphalodes CBS 100304]
MQRTEGVWVRSDVLEHEPVYEVYSVPRMVFSNVSVRWNIYLQLVQEIS